MRHPFNEPVPQGKPDLPAEFARLLHDDPIVLKVTKVTPVVRRRVTGPVVAHQCVIEFEGGSSEGVYLGLELRYPQTISLTSGKVRITRVDDTTCTGELVAFGPEDHEFKPPVVDETLTTEWPALRPKSDKERP